MVIAMEMSSQCTMRELRRVLDALGAWRTRPSVRALADALPSVDWHSDG